MILLNGPSERQLNLIKQELNEDDDRFEHNINLLTKWISFQEHLPQNYDPRILPIFLRGCKHDLERTKRKIELYYSVRKTIPELYGNRDPSSVDAMTACKVMPLTPLRDLNQDGCRVAILKLTTSDSSIYSMENIVRLIIMIGDLRVVEEHPIAGDIIIVDGGSNVTATHVAKVANTIVGRGMNVAHEAYPQRLKRIHVLNMPEIAEKILILIKSFMKEKMRNRFVVHRKPEELFDYISPEILPNEYGGQAGDLATMQENWQQYLISKKDWFKEQENVTAIGPIPKHLIHSCALDSNESIQGSFRKLAID